MRGSPAATCSGCCADGRTVARQARLAVAGHLHYVWLRGHGGLHVFAGAADRQLFLDALREASGGVVVHGVALTTSEAHLLVRPERPESLGVAVQAIGRRFVAGWNRRHGRRGTPWDGRYRSAVVEPGEWALAALCRVDQLAAGTAEADVPTGPPSRWAHDALRSLLADPPELWALGNTPFERERAWADRLAQPLLASQEIAIASSLVSGRVIGSDAFVRELERSTSRRLVARPRGRPPGTVKVRG